MIPTPSAVAPLLPVGVNAEGVQPLCGDGSVRRFYRVHAGSRSFVLCIGPDREENDAYVRLAAYLRSREVAVPTVYGYDPERGWVLMEDLGDRNLYRAALENPAAHALVSLYRPVLEALVQLQVEGARGYDCRLGHFKTSYSPQLMVEDEGLYFAREFMGELLGLEVPLGYREDIERLAAQGGMAPAHYLLHRDFQSRNIHWVASSPAIIDFQGCRPGPLAYDVAALLLDPYVGLPASVRETLLQSYRDLLRCRDIATTDFDCGWFAVGAFRLLQALGAFAKLGGRFGKPGFLEHAAQGLRHLLEHLGEKGKAEYPVLTSCVEQAAGAWNRRCAAVGACLAARAQ